MGPAPLESDLQGKVDGVTLDARVERLDGTQVVVCTTRWADASAGRLLTLSMSSDAIAGILEAPCEAATERLNRLSAGVRAPLEQLLKHDVSIAPQELGAHVQLPLVAEIGSALKHRVVATRALARAPSNEADRLAGIAAEEDSAFAVRAVELLLKWYPDKPQTHASRAQLQTRLGALLGHTPQDGFGTVLSALRQLEMVAPIHLVAARYPRASQALQGDIAIYADGTYDQGAWKAALETKRAGGHLALSAAPQGGGLSTADEDHVLALTD